MANLTRTMSETTEDYLDEDKVIKGQNFVCLSFLTPLSFPEDKREQYKNQKILGLVDLPIGG